jgi:chorismate mutase
MMVSSLSAWAGILMLCPMIIRSLKHIMERRQQQRWLYSSLNSNNIVKTSDVFSLDSIRSTLIRQEETIIFAIIERAQYRRNEVIYDPKQFHFRNVYGAPVSFLEWMFIETEKLHARVRRYTSPEEHAFYPQFLPEPILPALDFPQILVTGKEKVDVNSEIMRWYVEKILSRLCLKGDDEQHGSSVLCDITVMQALSRRIHYGKFVAESKYLSDPVKYEQLIREGKVLEVVDLLTNVEVERRVLRRAFVKASTYGQDIAGRKTEGSKIDPMLIADIYRDMIIPLTKDVEVRYLYHRLGLAPPSPDKYYDRCKGPTDAFDDPEELKKLSLP